MDKRIRVLIDKLAEHNFNVTYCMSETYSRKGKIETTYFFESIDNAGNVKDTFEENTLQAAVDKLIYNLACLRGNVE
jgi:hypothetical protein